jgi:hypothetical protein
MLVLLVAGALIRRLLWPAREPPVLLPPAFTIDASLDPSEGAVSGDAIGFAGPEIRLSGMLAPGATTFEGGEPAVIREE